MSYQEYSQHVRAQPGLEGVSDYETPPAYDGLDDTNSEAIAHTAQTTGEAISGLSAALTDIAR